MNEQAVFTAALERDPAEWSAFLDVACGEDVEFRQRVERLLQLHENAGDFLEHPATAGKPAPAAIENAERPGQTVGRYTLLEEIGEGGMGLVYRAEQHEPIRRQLALKIIKAGMDTRRVIARFETERQTLALMDHPNITRVLDAGATDSGRPYFVMELLEGDALTEYCDRHQFSIEQRLKLFMQVCHGVQHAHQKGVIHRDLKPSHVIVTLCDGLPVPKIIDFGIAKAIQEPLSETAMLTRHGQLMGTPLYMSPEQAQAGGFDVDTRSDIYSLGVILYELLSGCTPLGEARIREASYDEILRLIREDEPLRPSAHISALGPVAAAISANRRTDPGKLSRVLRRDLDWILLKALEKVPARRYQTVGDFARDIERYLCDEPIEAGPPSCTDRLVKWTRRHMGLVLACAAILCITSIISAASAVLIHEAWSETIQQRMVAEENHHEVQAQRHRAVTNFREALRVLQGVLRDDNMSQVMTLLEGLINNNSNDPGVRLQTGMAYVHLGRFHVRQGGDAQAMVAWEQSIATFQGLVTEFPEDHLYRVELGHSQNILGQFLYAHDKPTLAKEQFRRAADNFCQAVKLAEDVDTLNGCAWFLATCPDAALRDPRSAVAAAEKAVQWAPESGGVWNTLGVAYYRAEAWVKAITALEKSIALTGDTTSENAFFLSMAHWQLGHQSEARRYYDQAVSGMKKDTPPDEELFRFRAEAARLLGLEISPRPEAIPEQSM